MRPAGAAGKPKMDYVGLATLVLGVGALQILLDLGNDEDWFASQTIVAWRSSRRSRWRCS
jgi:hypothetical protein